MTHDDLILLHKTAGWAILRLAHTGPTTALRLMNYMTPGDAQLAYGYTPLTPRPPRPTPFEISLADEAMQRLSIIPNDQWVIRRIVALRMLYDDQRGRYIHPWRGVGRILRCSPRAAQSWCDRGHTSIARHITQDRSTRMTATHRFLAAIERDPPNDRSLDHPIHGSLANRA